MTPLRRSTLLLSASVLLAATAARAQPVITGTSGDELARSRRVAISGTGFGAGGDVVVGGLLAWTSTWTATRIVAYVPEAAPLGATTLQVVVGGQSSNAVPLTVTPRARDGRVRWTFEADSQNLWWRPALAPDGTLYLHASNETQGVVYALSPDGALLWIRHVNWYPYVPPSAGPDGEVYVGSLGHVFRISPAGGIDWEFVDPGAQGVHTAPTVGPDGRVYAAFDFGLGAVALDAATGVLQWSNPGDPVLNDFGTIGTEMRFGPSQPGGAVDQLYLHMDGVGSSAIYAFSLDGDQRFTAGLAALRSHEPAVGADGTIYAPFGTGLSIRAYDPADGSMLWSYLGGWATGVDDVEIGPDDTLFFIGNLGSIEAYDPHARQQLWQNVTGLVLERPTIDPAGEMLVVSGVPNYGQPGFVRAFDAATGAERWNVGLPGEPYPGFRVLGTHRPRFAADGATAYVSTFTVADGSPFPDPVSYLYAIDVHSEVLLADGFESGDTSAWTSTVP